MKYSFGKSLVLCLAGVYGLTEAMVRAFGITGDWQYVFATAISVALHCWLCQPTDKR